MKLARRLAETKVSNQVQARPFREFVGMVSKLDRFRLMSSSALCREGHAFQVRIRQGKHQGIFVESFDLFDGRARQPKSLAADCADAGAMCR